MGIDKILITIQNHINYSIKVALANGGIIEKVTAFFIILRDSVVTLW